jgi:ribonuclease P protein component
MRFTLGIEEKLKSKQLIKELFEKGNRVKSFPFQLIYLKKEHSSVFPIKVGFTVPKRSVKLAVNRNRIKRMMREVYRKNKHAFAENLKEQYIFMFIYMTKDELEYEELEKSILKVCHKFSTKITEDEQS